MTGFATVTSGNLTLTLKSVNGKLLDLHFHMPPAFDAAEPAMRQILREHIARGTVQVRIQWSSGRQNGLNLDLLKTWLATFRQAAAELGLNAEPDLNAALRLPGMFGPAALVGDPPDILPLLHQALAGLNGFRDREGARLFEELSTRVRSLNAIAGQIGGLREAASVAYHERLSARIAELLKSVADPQRLALEAALLVERTDISEELVRLSTHSAHLAELLALPGETGKKIDFLLQEMNREANTILSKTSGPGEIGLAITNLALDAKAEIDKIREQSLNLE